MQQKPDRVHVGLGDRAYDVLIGTGLLDQAGSLIAPLLHRPRVAIVSDSTVAEHHLVDLVATLHNDGIQATSLELPPARPPSHGPSWKPSVAGYWIRKWNAAIS